MCVGSIEQVCRSVQPCFCRLAAFTHSGVPFITTEGTQGGGLLAAVALNSLVATLIEKPNCHCHLKGQRKIS